MNTADAIMMGMMNWDRERKVFDWDKAASIIRELGLKDAMAGLQGDFENTGGSILEDGKPVMDDYTYLASTWATPVLAYYDDEDSFDPIEIPCYIMEHETEWDSHTKWPASALAALS